ncbi:MAG: prepilin-type N-terminal cleavage/methylation domain-containing protein [Candidatus Riflebacteria bacterium]|nr:prepilin-type N-terminal cleavage/methylation domain-containing protein [Candidatus Riflebacteria bacterium]
MMNNTTARNRQGMSMIELLVGVTLFGLAMLPLMWMGTTQTRGAYSVGKHMMAGQIAASFLDSLLGLPYKECLEKIQKYSGQGKVPVLDNADLQETLQSVADDAVKKDMETSFRYFRYQFGYSQDEDARILRLDLEVFYRVDESDQKSEQSVQLSVLKFGERNG